MSDNILLLGGDGFLGSGLQDELKLRNIAYKSIDKKDYDLINYANLSRCVQDFDGITYVVVLASKIGINLFNSSPVQASMYNKLLHKFIFDAVKLASQTYKKPYNVTYYSTSEIYGSLDSINAMINSNSPYSFIQNHDRYLYSYVKYKAETDYFMLNYARPDVVSSVKIVHPFNIYGKYLQRGVAYSMVKSALSRNVIEYCDDTTRTMTGLKFASKMSVDAILSHKNLHVNVADGRCSLTMKSLAHVISDILGLKDVTFVCNKPDNLILYRHVSLPDADIELAKSVMHDEILELAEQIKHESV